MRRIEAEQRCTRQADSAKRKRKKKQAAAAKLSFADEEPEDGDPGDGGAGSGTGGGDAAPAIDPEAIEPKRKIKRLTKDPKANTFGLPDRDRDEADRLERERLRKEWLAEQERVKGEVIEIVYSYWDGSGHRKSVEVS
jgi:protein FAM50